MKAYYLFDTETGELLGDGLAQKSPREANVWLCPEHSTYEEPPATAEHEIAVWDGSAWQIVPDWRGTQWWSTVDRTPHKIKTLNVIPGSNWTRLNPGDPESVWSGEAWVIPFEVQRQRKIIEVRNAADNQFRQLTADYSEVEIDSWAKQESGALAIKADPESTAEDAVFVRSIAEGRGVPVADLVEKILAAVDRARAESPKIIGIQQKLEDAAKAATDEQELNAIEWPLTT